MPWGSCHPQEGPPLLLHSTIIQRNASDGRESPGLVHLPEHLQPGQLTDYDIGVAVVISLVQ